MTERTLASDQLTIPPLAVIDARIEATKAELEALKKLRWAARALLRAEQSKQHKEQRQKTPRLEKQ